MVALINKLDIEHHHMNWCSPDDFVHQLYGSNDYDILRYEPICSRLVLFVGGGAFHCIALVQEESWKHQNWNEFPATPDF